MQDASIADAIVKRKWLSDFQREGILFNDTLAWCVSRYSYGNAPLFAMPWLNALSKPNICQDRLGTSIGKGGGKETRRRFLLQGVGGEGCFHYRQKRAEGSSGNKTPRFSVRLQNKFDRFDPRYLFCCAILY